MKTALLFLLCVLQTYDAAVGYLPVRVPTEGRRVRYRVMDDYETLEGGAEGFTYAGMAGPGLNPFTIPRGDVPPWGYDERMPLARYSDFNDFRRGAPADWGPHMGPMGAFSPFGQGVDMRLEQIRRKPNLTDREIQDLFFLWNNALATLDPDAVARRYVRNSPVLLPTVSDVPRTDYHSIRAYFVDFLKKRPQGKILQSHISRGPGWCMDAGIYEFVMGTNGERVTARYTFLYQYEDGEWKISHHHSSAMPENKGKSKGRKAWLGDGVMMQL